MKGVSSKSAHFLDTELVLKSAQSRTRLPTYFRELRYEVMSIGHFSSSNNLISSDFLRTSERNILSNRIMEEDRFLADDPDLTSQPVHIEVTKIVSIESDLGSVFRYEEQIREGREFLPAENKLLRSPGNLSGL